jgi:hypothetical protein
VYVRTTHVKRGDKSYRYAQLVESQRRASDGMVVKKVVANLGPLDDDAIHNLQLALKASKSGDRLALASVPAVTPAKPDQSLRYLDVAVCLQVWRELRLDELLSELMPLGTAAVAPGAVVAALAIHRLVDPGSKLHATRWFARTALPELLGVAPTALENTRLHRVLEQLDSVTPALMRALPSRYRERQAVFSALFLDVSDAWFYGRGPKMAQRGRCKDDVIRRMIGILLLCNEHGLPLRWSVMAGNCAETTAMLEQFRQLRHVTWAHQAPIVIDRALGRTAYLRELLESGVPFLTALVRPEIPNYVDTLPWRAVGNLALRGKPAEQREQLGQRVQEEGFTRLDETLYVRDLGVVEHDPEASQRSVAPDEPEDCCRFALQCALTIRDAVEAKTAPSRRAAGKAIGLAKGTVNKYGRLTDLSAPVQLAVLDGQARGMPLAGLIAVSALPADEQLPHFEALVARAATKPTRSHRAAGSRPASTGTSTVRLRAVAYFNPNVFLEQRGKAQRKLDRVADRLSELNTQLAAERSRRTRADALAAVDRILRNDQLLDAFDVHLTEESVEGRTVFSVHAVLRPAEWARRRAFDGFTVLVARPDCDLSPERRCRVYRAKDTVETDFRVIKSCVELRPVWHHNDAKVRAHVTVCMLALLLERELRRKLGETMTAQAALEHLADCRLNRYADSRGESAYLITRQDPIQEEILETLAMQHLPDDEQMADALWPR